MKAALSGREQALAIVNDVLEAAYRHDLPRLLAHYAADAVAVSPVFGEVRGQSAIGASWQKLFQTFHEFKYEHSDVLIDGDRIAVLGSVTITDRTGWFGLAATGSTISYRIVLIFTLRDGKIVHEERFYDATGVLERLEKIRLDKELHTAAEVQRALLSRTAQVSSFCESVGNSLPCRAIGGDFFEFLELPSGDVGIAMGDVSGKGPAAALLAAMLQGMFASEAEAGGGPAALLGRLNRRLAARQLDSRFTTLVYCVISPAGRLVYCNAGHNPPALLTGAGVRRLTAGGLMLGAFADTVFEEQTLQLSKGDTLVMFTDGVTEARNQAGEEFGEDRLMTVLRGGAASSPEALLGSTFDAVREFCQHTEQGDDITVTITRVR